MSPPLARANPFAVDAWFDCSCTLVYALPLSDIAQRVPAPLQVDDWQGRWGFLAVALVQTRKLRPAGLPAWMGSDFILAGYRYFVRCPQADGRRLRGLYIIRSQTDSRRMCVLGNLLTRYHYQHRPLRLRRSEQQLSLDDGRGGLRIRVDLRQGAESEVPLPKDSPFANWVEARRFCGPMPYTFSVDAESSRVVLVEGQRSNWRPRAVAVLEHRVPLLAQLGLGHARLANAFVVESVPYHWHRGRVLK
ncbi:MAG: hypothetical protein EA402_09565 [Planctomycetota bacterium]|nr:MAG: hypothetical protein EA402_09565 [Planctomycetota bacterium]